MTNHKNLSKIEGVPERMFGAPFLLFIIYVAVKEDTFCVRKSRKVMQKANRFHSPYPLSEAIKKALLNNKQSKAKQNGLTVKP